MSHKEPRKPSTRNQIIRGLILGLIAGLATMSIHLLVGQPAEPTKITLNQAVKHINAGDAVKAEVNDGANVLTLKLNDKVTTTPASKVADSEKKAPKKETPEEGLVTANFPYAYSDTLTELLVEKDVDLTSITPTGPGFLTRLITALLPFLLIFAFLWWLISRGGMTGGIGKMEGGRGNAIGTVPQERFSDVAGADEAVDELRELVEFLRNPEPFTKLGAKAPRGALLVGPPGTGKTLLARAVAGEAGVPFYPIAGSDFVETFVGVGAKRVRGLFDKARKAGTAIIFIDEIDAVGRARSGSGPSGGDSERENTMISMLNEMDGFDTGHRIIVLAATNRPDVLDAALTRPGRLDRQIQVPAPDRAGREKILSVHTAGRPIGEDVDLSAIARRCPGMVGADLAQLVNEACMEAVRSGADQVASAHFDAAIATLSLGRARVSAVVTDRDREITAWHEAGHTLAAFLQPEADNPVQVSIIPRGAAGGVTWMSGSDDLFLSRSKALAQLRVSLAGRAAEEILLEGDYTQGAHGDLQAATNLALGMVTKYGMTEFGYLNIDDDTIRLGSDVSEKVRAHAERLLAEAHADAARLLAEHKDFLTAVAHALLEEENLTGAQVAKIHDQVLADRENRAAV